jgi:hypothetical protein
VTILLRFCVYPDFSFTRPRKFGGFWFCFPSVFHPWLKIKFLASFSRHGQFIKDFLDDRFAGFFPGPGFFTALTPIRITHNFSA